MVARMGTKPAQSHLRRLSDPVTVQAFDPAVLGNTTGSEVDDEL